MDRLQYDAKCQYDIVENLTHVSMVTNVADSTCKRHTELRYIAERDASNVRLKTQIFDQL